MKSNTCTGTILNWMMHTCTCGNCKINPKTNLHEVCSDLFRFMQHFVAIKCFQRVSKAIPMASSTVAPEPPSGFTKPEGYIALRCQFCLSWSTMPSPFTHSKADQCKFWPLIPWYLGSRESPKGCICLVCVNVSWHSLVHFVHIFDWNHYYIYFWTNRQDKLHADTHTHTHLAPLDQGAFRRRLGNESGQLEKMWPTFQEQSYRPARVTCPTGIVLGACEDSLSIANHSVTPCICP